MGFLDHSTNNVIVDAVLTDEGRRLLATQGTLTPTKFSLADDEVDYTLLTKFGRQVGKEKIIKNIYNCIYNINYFCLFCL